MKKHEIHYLDTTLLAFIGKGILVGAFVGIVVRFVSALRLNG